MNQVNFVFDLQIGILDFFLIKNFSLYLDDI